MKRLTFWPILLLALGVALVFTGRTFAQSSSITDDQVNAVAKQMYCPVCENIPLDVCPTQACSQWRELIRQKLAAGWSAEQIKQYFATHYGDRVLGVPPVGRGINWLIYVVLVIALVVGIYLVYHTIHGSQPRSVPGSIPLPGDPGAGAPSGPKDPYLARVEDELKKRR